MAQPTHRTLPNANFLIKIASLLLGFGFWSLFNQMHPSHITTSVPLCFYGPKTTDVMCAPETVCITIAGKRNDLARLDLSTLAAHIDTATLNPGPNAITLTQAHLFLPTSCNLLHCTPSNIFVSLKEVTPTV